MLGVLGDLVEDIVMWLVEPLRSGTDTEASICRTRGGSAANVAAFAASVYPTRFIGCVGTDGTGDRLVSELTECGVDVRVQRRGHTGTVVVLIDQDCERSMFPDRGAATLLQALEPDWLDDLEHLHVPAYSLAQGQVADTAREALAAVRARGGTVSIDASSAAVLHSYGVSSFLHLLRCLSPNWLFANRTEADVLSLADCPLPATPTVIKNGADPTQVLIPGHRPVRVPVAPVAGIRDLTGAGDAFAAGFLTALLHGADTHTACTAGHDTAHRVLRVPGARVDARKP